MNPKTIFFCSSKTDVFNDSSSLAWPEVMARARAKRITNAALIRTTHN
jgi:hypothetical protein